MIQQFSERFACLRPFFVISTERFNIIQLANEQNLISSQKVPVLVLQMNWVTLNNLVINSPLTALVLFSGMTNWSDPRSPGCHPLSSAVLLFFFFLLLVPPPNPKSPSHFTASPFLEEDGAEGVNGAMAAAYRSRSWHTPVALLHTFMCSGGGGGWPLGRALRWDKMRYLSVPSMWWQWWSRCQRRGQIDWPPHVATPMHVCVQLHRQVSPAATESSVPSHS